MKYAYYIFCPIPAICLLISMLLPDDFNAGGSSVTIQLELALLFIVSCPILTLIGLIAILAPTERKRGLVIATVISASPGICVLIANIFNAIAHN